MTPTPTHTHTIAVRHPHRPLPPQAWNMLAEEMPTLLVTFLKVWGGERN